MTSAFAELLPDTKTPLLLNQGWTPESLCVSIMSLLSPDQSRHSLLWPTVCG